MKISPLSANAENVQKATLANMLSVAEFSSSDFLHYPFIDNANLQQLMPAMVELVVSLLDQYLLTEPRENSSQIAKFYQMQLEAKNSSLITKEIILCSLLTGLIGTPFEEDLNFVLQTQFGRNLTISNVLNKFELHLKARCIAVASEFNLQENALQAKLYASMHRLNHIAQTNACPLAILFEITALANQLGQTALMDLLPPQVSPFQKLEDLMSDHLPQLYQFKGAYTLNWNILTKNYFIGFAEPGGKHSVVETNAGYKRRLANIANFLLQATKAFNITIICLQEAYEDLCFYLPENFKNKWAILIHTNKMLFYKKQIWTAEEGVSPQQIQRLFSKNKVQSLRSSDFQSILLKQVKTDKKLIVYNVYTAHEDDPDNLEAAINTLNAFHAKDTALSNIPVQILGDFNRRLPDWSIYAKDNATHLVPPEFRMTFKPRRIYDYTDCCFQIDNGNLVQQNGDFLNTLKPTEFFMRPLVSLNQALENKQFAKIIFPLLHKIRAINKEKTHFGELTLATFIQRLEKQTQQKITAIEASKNRFGLLSLNLQFEKANPLLDALDIASKNHLYHFIVVLQTADQSEQVSANKRQENRLDFIEIINIFGSVVDLYLPK